MVGQYSHGNEPCHHVAYLYALAGAQYKTALRVHQIALLHYDNTPEGICGNDDCGQMSAWYVWSAMGLYPLNPADGKYVIGLLKLVPVAGLGQIFQLSQSPAKLFGSGNFSKRCNDKEIITA